MHSLEIRNRNEVINRVDQDHLPDDRDVKNSRGSRLRRRWGGRLFALGGFSLLAGGLSLGALGNYSQQQEVLATAMQERDHVPSLRVATVEASPGIMSVTLPGTTAAFAAANIYARATGYIAKRNVDIGDRAKAGDLLAQLAVPELDDQIRQNEATPTAMIAPIREGTLSVVPVMNSIVTMPQNVAGSARITTNGSPKFW